LTPKPPTWKDFLGGALATARLTFRSGARVCAIYGGADAIPQLRKFAGGIEIGVCRWVGWLDRPLVGLLVGLVESALR